MDYTEDKIHNVIGYAKTEDDDLNKPNLEWNMVQIDNKYCLIDSTWGARITNSNKKLVSEYDEYLLFIPPIQFFRK